VSSAPLTSTVDGQSNAAKVFQPSRLVAVTNFPRSNPKVGLDQTFLRRMMPPLRQRETGEGAGSASETPQRALLGGETVQHSPRSAGGNDD
jgi:hypothetical protein